MPCICKIQNIASGFSEAFHSKDIKMHRVLVSPEIAQDLGRTQRLVQWDGGASVTSGWECSAGSLRVALTGRGQ